MSKYLEMDKFAKRANEKSDCAVKAVAVATDTHYFDVWSMMNSEGRCHRQGTPNPITYSVLKRLGFRTKDVTDDFSAKTVLTLGRQMKHASGAFLVWVRGHILCIKDGEVCDWTQGRRHRIEKIVKIEYQTAARDEA